MYIHFINPIDFIFYKWITKDLNEFFFMNSNIFSEKDKQIQSNPKSIPVQKFS